MASEKTEKPTPRRVREAERRGQISVSRDLGSAAALAAAAAPLVAAAGWLAARLEAAMRDGLERAAAAETLDLAQAMHALVESGRVFAIVSMPIACAAAAASAVALLLQTRGRMSASSLAPKPERFNPVAGIKKLVSARALSELVKTFVKVAAVAGAVVSALAGHWTAIADTSSLPGALGSAAGLAVDATLRAAAALLVLGAGDVLLQRWLHERELRMSKDEVRRDLKEDEGDPHVKHARRHLHRELAASVTLAAVRSASVVVANPTHVAAALRYDGDGEAPRVVAKGIDRAALRIRRMAELAGVPVVENRELARVLHRVDLDAPVPESLYEAVAAVLVALEAVAGRPHAEERKP